MPPISASLTHPGSPLPSTPASLSLQGRNPVERQLLLLDGSPGINPSQGPPWVATGPRDQRGDGVTRQEV